MCNEDDKYYDRNWLRMLLGTDQINIDFNLANTNKGLLQRMRKRNGEFTSLGTLNLNTQFKSKSSKINDWMSAIIDLDLDVFIATEVRFTFEHDYIEIFNSYNIYNERVGNGCIAIFVKKKFKVKVKKIDPQYVILDIGKFRVIWIYPNNTDGRIRNQSLEIKSSQSQKVS